MVKWMRGCFRRGVGEGLALAVLLGAGAHAVSLRAATAAAETSFWVLLREKAELEAALQMRDDVARGDDVYRRLREVAERSQAGLRAELDARGAAYQAFWIVNAVRVVGDRSLRQALAARPEVAAVVSDRGAGVPVARRGIAQLGGQGVDWGLERIGATRVWSQYSVQGANIVVANIDTGVQYDHPALVRQYRGNLGGGSFDHNYNWFDPTGLCGVPPGAPCDTVYNGTATMGLMVGDDGLGPNLIGVAPKARWIAAKGCETTSCSLAALLASGQWILAPTDLAGNNPQPALRPHVVNNSWVGAAGDPFFSDMVDAWDASGIFSVFAAGDDGPACGTSGSPGDYVASYSVGAFDINNDIARFSSRGPSVFGVGKPNMSAPGVNVRTSVPPGTYSTLGGTAVAAPHVAGSVALLWSWSTTLTRDVALTRRDVNKSARNMLDLTCGGNVDKNNVWGDGRLNVLNAVRIAPLP